MTSKIQRIPLDRIIRHNLKKDRRDQEVYEKHGIQILRNIMQNIPRPQVVIAAANKEKNITLKIRTVDLFEAFLILDKL